MTELKEHDGMTCRACGREERASEGYPCANCMTFICLICSFRGVTLCARCAAESGAASPEGVAAPAPAPAATEGAGASAPAPASPDSPSAPEPPPASADAASTSSPQPASPEGPAEPAEGRVEGAE